MDYTLKNIDSNLWRQVKALAAMRGISIKQLIIDLLVREVAQEDEHEPSDNGEDQI
jgi:hypothetical protein